MRDFTQPKEFEEEQFKRYPVYSGNGLVIEKDDFSNIILDTYKYGVTFYFRDAECTDVDKTVFYNRLTRKIIFLDDDDVPEFVKPLFNFSELKTAQEVESIVDKFFNLRAFL